VIHVEVFTIRHDPWYKWIAVVCGLVPRWNRVTVDGDRILVRMSYAFSSTFDRSAIRSVTPWTGRVWSWGVHGWRQRWLVNGSSQGILVLGIDPPARARVLGWPIHVRELAVSLDDPVGFAAAAGFGVASPTG
jgi:hypothetical protein